MFMDFWCEIYESVKRKPSRTILTGIGISWGIFILIVLVGIGLNGECSNSSMDSLKARLMYMRQKHQWDIKERLVEEKYNFKKKI